MDAFDLIKLAGHTDIKTTERYVHRNDADTLKAMEKAWGTHRIGHSAETSESGDEPKTALIN